MEWNADQVVAEVSEALDARVREAANVVARGARQLAPKGKTGMLRASIQVNRIAPGRYEITATDYKAIWHELGTSRMRARPFLRRSLIENRAQVEATIAG
jgi:HK97 gp10 family phage protein